MKHRYIYAASSLALALAIGCDTNDDGYANPRFEDAHADEFEDDPYLTDEDVIGESEHDENVDLPAFIVSEDEWDFETLEDDEKEGPVALDEVAAEIDAASGKTHFGTWRTYVSYPFFNCPSSSTMIKAARNKCIDRGFSGSTTRWITECYGVSGRPGWRRRQIGHSCYWWT